MSQAGFLSQTGSSDVVGPGSSTDRSVPTWNGTTGTVLRNNPDVLITSNGALSMGKGQIINRTATAVSYAVLATDYYIGVTNTAATRTITLPAAPATNQVFIVKDESGGADAINIVVTAGGVINIDGGTTVNIATNYGSLNFIFNGSQYFIW